jgi:hypothetical protein
MDWFETCHLNVLAFCWELAWHPSTWMPFNNLVFSNLDGHHEPTALLFLACSLSTLPKIPSYLFSSSFLLLLLILPLILPCKLIKSILQFCPLCFSINNYNEKGSPSTLVEYSHVWPCFAVRSNPPFVWFVYDGSNFKGGCSGCRVNGIWVFEELATTPCQHLWLARLCISSILGIVVAA